MTSSSSPPKRAYILGQDVEILKAMLANLLSWFVSTFLPPSFLNYLLPPCSEEEDSTDRSNTNQRTKCISINRPGGLEQLRLVTLREDIVTCGYNLPHISPPPFCKIPEKSSITNENCCFIIQNKCFSINYADCCIRWGLYESANKFVGWPIVPGFDIAGKITDEIGNINKSGANKTTDDLKIGDEVFGCTLFGAYSNRVIVPKTQLRRVPKGLSCAQAASLPAVSLTALYALTLAGHYTPPTTDQTVTPIVNTSNQKYSNRSILIHSAAGGVGSMLVQMSKLLNLHPIVGVVGSTAKVPEAKALGCDIVIDKSSTDLWEEAGEVVTVPATSSRGKYKTIMDANGVSTLQQSFDHLAATGRLIVFGFHSNLPMGQTMLSPKEWIKMATKANNMPKFDPMDMVTDNKSILGFNLSFFSEEQDVLSDLFDQLCAWLEEGSLKCPRIVTMGMDQVGEAHNLIQSGKSVGKIVIEIE